MNCWQCRGHACDEMTHVRNGRGQVGQAAARFCARLNPFKRLTPLFCNSKEGPAFAHGEASAWRRAAHSPYERGQSRRRSHKMHIIYVLLIFLSSSRRYAARVSPTLRTPEPRDRRDELGRRTSLGASLRLGLALRRIFGCYRLMAIAWPGRGAGFPLLGATAVGSRRAKSEPIGRPANWAATLRPALTPGTSIREYIARAAISDSIGAIKTAATIPTSGWSQ